MNLLEAQDAIAKLVSYFPGMPMPESTLGSWSAEIEWADFPDAAEAAGVLGRMSRRWPSLTEWLEEIREARSRRLAREGLARPALGSGTWTEEDAKRSRETAAKLLPRFLKKSRKISTPLEPDEYLGERLTLSEREELLGVPRT